MALVAHYRFDGDATDALKGNDLTFGLSGSWVRGKFGQAFSIAGTGGGAQVAPSSFGLNPNTNRWTVCGWVIPNRTSWETDHGSGLNRHNVFEMGEYYIEGETSITFGRHTTGTTSRALFFSIYQNQTSCEKPPAHNFTVDELDDWIFFAVTCNGSELAFHSFAEATGNWQRTGAAVSWDVTQAPIRDNLHIGGYGWASGGWRGVLEDFRVYDHALSLREIYDLSLGVIADYRCPAYQDALVAGFLPDASGQDNHAAIAPSEAPTWTSEGYRFDGTQCINAGSVITMEGRNRCAIECEFELDDVQDQQALVAKWNTYGVGRQFLLDVYQGKVRATFGKGVVDDQILITHPIQAGTRYHVLAVKTPTEQKLFVNGSLVASAGNPATFLGNSEPLVLGGKSDDGAVSAKMQGLLVRARILSVAVSDEMAQALYRNRASLDALGNFTTREITELGQSAKPIIDYSVWKAGQTASVGDFSRNGASNKNSRVNAIGPHGKEIVVWQCDNTDTESASDGGWNYTPFRIDNTKRYRFSVWVRRTSPGNGSAYLGTRGYGAAEGVELMGGGTNTNPYFWSGGIDHTDWFLIVGHVHPAGYSGGVHPDTARYLPSGRVDDATDFIWRPETETATHRAYLYYSTDLSTRQQFAYPRVDVCDGTEPTVQQLLDGFDERLIESDFKGQVSLVRQATVSEVGVGRGLVAWYPLCGDTMNYASSDHGTAVGALPSDWGYEFSGVDQHIACGKPAELSEITDELSISYWCRFEDAGDQDHPVVACNESDTWLPGNGFVIGHGWGDTFYFGVGSNVRQNLHTPLSQDGQMHHVCLTYSSAKGARLYIDGVQAFEDTSWTGPVGQNSEDLFIGKANYRGGSFKGRLADVRIYSTRLEDDEVGALAKLNPTEQTKVQLSADGLRVHGQLKETTI